MVGLKTEKETGGGGTTRGDQEGQGRREKGGGESLKHASFKMSQYYLTHMLISIFYLKEKGQ